MDVLHQLEEANGCALAYIWQPTFAQYNVEDGTQIAHAAHQYAVNLTFKHIFCTFIDLEDVSYS